MLYGARHATLDWLIVHAVPALNVFRRGYPWKTSLDSLERMGPESWGAKLEEYLRMRGMNFLPKYQQHDALHVLLNYDTTPVDEVRLQAFMVGNGTASLAGRVLLRIGMILLPECRAQIRIDRDRGASSTAIDWLRIEAEMPNNIAEVRRRWNIEPVDEDG